VATKPGSRRMPPLRFGAATCAIALALLAQAALGDGKSGPVHPTWGELSSSQREALAPLAGDWDKFDPVRKKKWLEVASKYPHLSPEGQQHVHERMGELARMTPQERVTTRENFVRAYQLPLDQRQALVQKYQDLPADQKKELAAKPTVRPETPRKPTTPPKAPAAAAASPKDTAATTRH